MASKKIDRTAQLERRAQRVVACCLEDHGVMDYSRFKQEEFPPLDEMLKRASGSRRFSLAYLPRVPNVGKKTIELIKDRCGELGLEIEPSYADQSLIEALLAKPHVRAYLKKRLRIKMLENLES